MDREPWYYQVAERLAWGVLALATGQAVLCLMLVVAVVVSPREGDLSTTVWRVPYSLAAMVGADLIATAVLLMVDVARNIREIRNAGER